MPAIFHDFLLIFIPLFVVIDPAGTIPVYLALTAAYPEAQRRRTAVRAASVAAAIGVLFVFLGQATLRFLGVRFEDFQIAGGILLAILAIIDLLIKGKPAVESSSLDPADTLGIFPLGVPLIVGPATMTTSLLLVNTYSKTYNEAFGTPWGQMVVSLLVCLALLINIALLLAAMWHSGRLIQWMGRNTLFVVNKIVMILLAAIAVSLVRQGVVGIIQNPGGG